IDRAENGRGARQMDGEDHEVDRGPRMAHRGQRRIEGPAGSRAVAAGRAGHEERKNEEQEGWRQQPERNVVEAWESHVRRADHDRYEPVAEAADQCGHDHEKYHHQAMGADEDVEELAVGEKLQARRLKLETDRYG